jgi:hypothetical protein
MGDFLTSLDLAQNYIGTDGRNADETTTKRVL